MAKGRTICLGIFVGGTVSAAVTLLTAPSSGRKMRMQAKEQGAELKDLIAGLKQNSVRLKQQVSDTSREGVSLIKNLTTEMKQSIEEWMTSVEPHQDNIQGYLKQIEDSLKELEENVQKKNESEA